MEMDIEIEIGKWRESLRWIDGYERGACGTIESVIAGRAGVSGCAGTSAEAWPKHGAPPD